MVEKKRSVLPSHPTFSTFLFPEERARSIGRSCNLFGEKTSVRFPFPPYFRWIKRPVSRERHFAIIKKRREISLKKQSLLRSILERAAIQGKKRASYVTSFHPRCSYYTFEFIYSKGYCVLRIEKKTPSCETDKWINRMHSSI